MNMKLNRNQGGAVMVETALVFVSLMFLICGIFEFGRAMWTYHTLSAAVKEATRFAIVRGARCAEESNACAATVADVSQVLRRASLGLNPARLAVSFETSTQSVSCNPVVTCLSSSSQWPPSPFNAVGMSLTIGATYPFESVWMPTWSAEAGSTLVFNAKSTEIIQF